MQGQDFAILLKLAIQIAPQTPSKNLAESLCVSQSEVSKALKRGGGCMLVRLLDPGGFHLADC